MNASLKIVTGHVYVVAWFLAMHDHINKHDWSHVILLWQAALTVTLHCRVGLNSKQLAVLSIQMSETQKKNARLMCDSFMAFSYKALIAAQDAGTVAQKQKALNDAGVRFNGNSINKNTMQGILLFQDKVSPAASQALREIERQFGKDVFTGGYVKLVRLCQVCERLQGMVIESHTTEQLVTYVIQFLEWGLRFEFIEPKNITVEGLDKGRDGSFGLVYLCLGRLHILGVVSCWVQDCKKVATAAALAGELETLLQHFSAYPKFEQTFNASDSKAAAPAASQEETTVKGDSIDKEDDEEPIDIVKKQYKNKAAHQIIDWLYDLMSLLLDDHIEKALQKIPPSQRFPGQTLTGSKDCAKSVGSSVCTSLSLTRAPAGRPRKTVGSWIATKAKPMVIPTRKARRARSGKSPGARRR